MLRLILPPYAISLVPRPHPQKGGKGLGTRLYAIDSIERSPVVYFVTL